MTPETRANFRFVLPIYGFITLLLGYLLFLSVMALRGMGQGGVAGLLALLGGLHIALYWLNIWLPERPWRWSLYYVAQTALIVALGLMARLNGVGVTIFESAAICLIGEALGWWGNSRRALWIGLFYTLLVILMTLLLGDRQAMLSTLFAMLLQAGGIIIIMLLFNQQAAAHDRALALTEKLEAANAQLAASASQIERLTRQTERRRMARELHDTLAQGVTGLVLQLEAAKAHLSAGRSERAEAIIDHALSRARETLADSRAAIDDLRSESEEFEQQLKHTLKTLLAHHAINSAVSLDVQRLTLPATTLDHAEATLREAVSNALRHAEATELLVSVVGRGERLALTVQDNGRGFDPDTVTDGHYGLLGMRERARLIGADLQIRSAPQQGTLVKITIGTPP